MLNHLDIKPRKVCFLAKQFLQQMYSMPVLSINLFDKKAFRHCKPLIQFQILRRQLASMKDFIMVCRKKKMLLDLLA